MARSNTSVINHLDGGINHLSDLDIQKASDSSTTDSTFPTTLKIVAETQVEVDEASKLFNVISPHFSVKPTKYGGRSCFANSDLTEGTIVHECSLPLGSTITRSFKKEVCGSCFTFLHGRTLKFKLMSSNNQQHDSTSVSSLALYFCSQACVDQFIASDVDSLHLESLLHVESLFIKGLSRHLSDLDRTQKKEEEATLQLENELKQAKDIELFISQKWQDAEIMCHMGLSKLKPKQRMNFNNLYNLIPKINEDEYLEIKYIIGILFQMYKHDNCQNNNLLSLELQIFPLLQSNDIEKISKYPYLLHSFTRIYKFLRISILDKLQPYITPSRIRSIIGKRLTNFFGIWSTDEPDVEKEFFGYLLYPSASFFNHSCHPNLLDTRTGATITFKLLKNVKQNEELLISYVPSNNDFETRQKDLKEWFFECLCERCIEEKNLKKPEK